MGLHEDSITGTAPQTSTPGPLIDYGCKCLHPSNKLYRTRIASDNRIRREKHHALDNRLSNENPIEWIFVQGRKGINFYSVHARDGKLAIAIV